MALTKRLYKDHEVVITAKNLNDIQDAILALEQMAGIVPGEGETTKIINVVNPSGTLTPEQAAALPDGLYWMANPLTLQDAEQTEEFEVSGLTAKAEYTWVVYATGAIGTTDESGVLVEWYDGYTAAGTQLTGIHMARSGQTVTITTDLEGGGTDEMTVNLDENDFPASVTIANQEITVTTEGF